MTARVAIRVVEISRRCSELVLQKQLGNLNGVEGRTFADLIPAQPQLQGLGLGDVLAGAARRHFILAGYINGHGKAVLLPIFNEHHPRGPGQDLPGFFHREGLFKLQVEGLGSSWQ
jgi:hypothetical protein